MKTATIDVPIEVRKPGPDLYQFRHGSGEWSTRGSETYWRGFSSVGARAIIQAIDSGAFADPLPTAEGAHVYNPKLKVHFFRANVLRSPWAASQRVEDILWHTSEQVQSYGPFEVLYDPEAMS